MRLLHLLSLLQARPHWSGPELADELGITTRTVRRDVERLRDLGYPVDASLGAQGGYRLAPTGAMPPLALDDDEAIAVAVALRTTAATDVARLDDAALRAMAKLEQVLPPRLRPRVSALTSMTVALRGAAGPASIDPDLLVTLTQACRASQRLRFDYLDSRGRPSERTVEPLRLVHAGRRWYLAAFDVRRAAWRTFRVDRISAVENTGHRFVHRDPPDAAALVAEAISTAPYRHTARVVVHAPLAAVASVVPATTATLHEVDRSTTRLVTGSDHLEAIAMHLAGLPFDFTVEEPDELRALLLATAERLTRAAGVGGGAASASARAR